jgi:hypothetical protein
VHYSFARDFRITQNAMQDVPVGIRVRRINEHSRRRFAVGLGPVANKQTDLSAFRQEFGQPLALATAIPENDPPSRPVFAPSSRLAQVPRTPASKDDGVPPAVFLGVGSRDCHDIPETLLQEQARPLALIEERIRGSQGQIRESPPPVSQPERNINPALGSCPFQQEEHPARRQHACNVLQRPPQVRRGVQHICRDDKVERLAS